MTDIENIKLKTPLRSIIGSNNAFQELLPFDEYHLVMAQSDFLEGIHETKTVKTYFYRLPPFGGSYVIFAGLSALLNKIDSFDYKKIAPYLREKDYNKNFVKYIENRNKIKVNVISHQENTPAFPYEPMVIIETTLLDGRMLEGIILTELNFASLCTTKWHRIINAAQKRPIMEFGRRRAQNPLKASLYSYIAGVNSTSNCEANLIFGIPSSGTMGHEYMQSFATEAEAFNKWLYHNPKRPCLLLDTLSVIESGLPNAIMAFQKHKQRLMELGVWNNIAVRIDSGDLAYLGLNCYKALKTALNTENITIVLSNDLDEYSITSIFSQLVAAGESELINKIAFGIGTKGVTAWGEPALGGVCKLSELGDNIILKISNNIEKTTLPGNLRSTFVTDLNGQYVTTLIHFHTEDPSKINKFVHLFDDTKYIDNDFNRFSLMPRQSIVYTCDGNNSEFIGVNGNASLESIRNNSEKYLKALDWSYKRTSSPHSAKVSLSPKLFEIRKQMVKDKIISAKFDNL